MKIVQHTLVGFGLVFILISGVFAKTPANIPLDPTSAKKPVDYLMPYPGVLPDHPLYKVKLVRDRLLDFLIVEPVKKSEFYILQADKRILMGVALLDKGSASLAEQTISKAETYLSKAAFKLEQAKKEGKELPSYMLERIEGSSAKHEEILTTLISRAPAEVTVGLSGSLDILKKTIVTVASLR